MKSVDKINLKSIISLIIKVRPINPFTKRGLRNSKSILKKKIGKKSN